MGIKHYEEKIPTQLEWNPRLSRLEVDVGPLHHRAAASIGKKSFTELLPCIFRTVSAIFAAKTRALNPLLDLPFLLNLGGRTDSMILTLC